MAADAYLKVAAGQLQQAATEVKREADQTRAEATNLRGRLDTDIISLKTNLTAVQLEIDRNKDDPTAYAHLRKQAYQIQSEIDSKKNEMDKIVSQAEQKARGKEGAMQGLKSQAQQLEQQASDPNLR